MNIALALSGGGFRATVFHLGVLARLAKANRLEEVNFLSTVSGGSLCAGLVFTENSYKWPTSAQYRNTVFPKVKEILTTVDLKGAMIRRAILHFYEITDTRADDLSILMREHWGVDIAINELPESPRWMINATCYETGKNWRFERFRMGDYLFGYTYDTDLPLSDAMAASAGFPGLIGALTLETSHQKWFKYLTRSQNPETMNETTSRKRKTKKIQPPYSPVHLWDGGVYDNHGLEGLYNFNEGWREEFDFLVVSDAAGRSKPQAYQPGIKAMERIVTGIMMDQIRSLRARSIIERMKNHNDQGVFLQTGNTCEYVLRASGHKDEIGEKCSQCLSMDEADRAANMETDIAKLSEETFERLFRHGYEVADYTLYAYHYPEFKFEGYNPVDWY